MIDKARRTTLTRRQVRDLQRAVHLLTAVALLLYVYGAPALGPAFTDAVRWVVLPTLVISGGALWKWTQVRSSMRRHRVRA